MSYSVSAWTQAMFERVRDGPASLDALVSMLNQLAEQPCTAPDSKLSGVLSAGEQLLEHFGVTKNDIAKKVSSTLRDQLCARIPAMSAEQAHNLLRDIVFNGALACLPVGATFAPVLEAIIGRLEAESLAMGTATRHGLPVLSLLGSAEGIARVSPEAIMALSHRARMLVWTHAQARFACDIDVLLQRFDAEVPTVSRELTLLKAPPRRTLLITTSLVQCVFGDTVLYTSLCDLIYHRFVATRDAKWALLRCDLYTTTAHFAKSKAGGGDGNRSGWILAADPYGPLISDLDAALGGSRASLDSVLARLRRTAYIPGTGTNNGGGNVAAGNGGVGGGGLRGSASFMNLAAAAAAAATGAGAAAAAPALGASTMGGTTFGNAADTTKALESIGKELVKFATANKPHGRLFTIPVRRQIPDPAAYARYCEFIAPIVPIDLSEIATFAAQGKYPNVEAMRADVARVVAACEKYNTPASELANVARQCAEHFEALVSKRLGLGGAAAGGATGLARRASVPGRLSGVGLEGLAGGALASPSSSGVPLHAAHVAMLLCDPRLTRTAATAVLSGIDAATRRGVSVTQTEAAPELPAAVSALFLLGLSDLASTEAGTTATAPAEGSAGQAATVSYASLRPTIRVGGEHILEVLGPDPREAGEGHSPSTPGGSLVSAGLSPVSARYLPLQLQLAARCLQNILATLIVSGPSSMASSPVVLGALSALATLVRPGRDVFGRSAGILTALFGLKYLPLNTHGDWALLEAFLHLSTSSLPAGAAASARAEASDAAPALAPPLPQLPDLVAGTPEPIVFVTSMMHVFNRAQTLLQQPAPPAPAGAEEAAAPLSAASLLQLLLTRVALPGLEAVRALPSYRALLHDVVGNFLLSVVSRNLLPAASASGLLERAIAAMDPAPAMPASAALMHSPVVAATAADPAVAPTSCPPLLRGGLASPIALVWVRPDMASARGRYTKAVTALRQAAEGRGAGLDASTTGTPAGTRPTTPYVGDEEAAAHLASPAARAGLSAAASSGSLAAQAVAASPATAADAPSFNWPRLGLSDFAVETGAGLPYGLPVLSGFPDAVLSTIATNAGARGPGWRPGGVLASLFTPMTPGYLMYTPGALPVTPGLGPRTPGPGMQE